MSKEKIRCPICEGFGYFEDNEGEQEDCDRCNGAGTIEVETEEESK